MSRDSWDFDDKSASATSFTPDDFAADELEEQEAEVVKGDGTADHSEVAKDSSEGYTEEEYVTEEVVEEYSDESNSEEGYQEEPVQESVVTKKASKKSKKQIEEPKEVVAKISKDYDATDAQDAVINGQEVQKRTVDPTKSSSRKKRDDKKEAQAKKKADKAAKKEQLKKKPIIPIVVVLIVAIAVIIFLMTGKKDDKNFLSLTKGILNADLGTFVYEIDVVTKAHDVSVENTTVSVEDLNNMESADTGTEESDEFVPNNSFVEWTNSEGSLMTSWKYPSYKITVEGNCPSVEPFTADYKISLSTAQHTGVLTEIIVCNGNTYVDIDSLGNWLRASKDTYLSRLGDQVPVGAKWLLIPSGEFNVPSRYAEDAELELSNVSSINEMNERNILLFNMVLDTVTSAISDEAYGTTQSAYTINIADGKPLVDSFRKMVTNGASCYSGYVNSAYSKGFYTDEQAKQALREEDNVMKALTDLLIYMNYATSDSFNLQVAGNAREYKDSFGNQAVESTFATSFQTSEKDYKISAKLTRLGKKVEITEPTETSITKAQLTDENTIRNVFFGVMDYLNPTSFKLELKQEMNPERIKENVKQSLIDLVNATESAEIHLTKLTVDDYIQKYATLDPSVASTTDLINAQIVSDYLAVLGGITDNITYASEVEEEVEDVPQYPELVYEDPNIKITAKVVEEESDSSLICLNLFILNKTNSEVTLDLTNFTMQTLLSSVYPANNLVLLKNYDNSWDEALTPETLVMGEHDYADINLYFVISNDKGYMDLWFGEDKLGEIVAY